METLAAPHIVIRDTGTAVQPVIAGKGHKVKIIARLHVDQGVPAAEISELFDLTPAEVHSALAYYYDHEPEMRSMIDDDDRIEAESGAQNPSLLRKKLGQRTDSVSY